MRKGIVFVKVIIMVVAFTVLAGTTYGASKKLKAGDKITVELLKYRVLEDAKSLEVIGYIEIPREGKVVIPKKVKGLKVVAVAEKAFNECTKLKIVEMKSVQTVKEKAFFGCRVLEMVSVKDVKIVGEWAFYGCEAITTMVMPKVKTVGEWAFGSCKNLTKVEMPKTESCFQPYSFNECEWQPEKNGVSSSCQ